MRKLLICWLLLSVSCGFWPEKVDMSDPKLQPMLKAAAVFDRITFGFSPIPSKADVRLELRSGREYDAMLHIYSKTSRTIAFRKTEEGYRWIGEQESFQGPKQYTTVDGTFYESITLTYDIEKVSGYPTNKLNVSYWGEDPRLVDRRELTLKEVQPILKDWGYDV